MEVSRLEVVPYRFPEIVSETRSCLIARKVLELYGVVRPFFDFDDDADLIRTIDSHTSKQTLVAREPRIDSEDSVKGFLSYDIDRELSAMTIHSLVVDENARGRGVGGRLLYEAENLAERDDLWSINLRSTESALDFYESKGYQLVDEGESMMQLRLPRL